MTCRSIWILIPFVLVPILASAQSSLSITNPVGSSYNVDGITVWTHAACAVNISSISESGTTATLTAVGSLPTCVTVGSTFTIVATSVPPYNTSFVVSSLVSGTQFTFTATPGMTTSSGGSAGSFRGTTMVDAILSMASGQAGSFYENNCLEPAYPANLFGGWPGLSRSVRRPGVFIVPTD
jgi:hypothetical protein